MEDGIIITNQVFILGKVVSRFRFNHEMFGERFYDVLVSIKRQSGAQDIIPVIVSDKLVDVTRDYIGCYIDSLGQFRSYNQRDGIRWKLVLFVFAFDIVIYTSDLYKQICQDANHVILDGFICKEPVYRTTPTGREITDVMMAVNRSYKRTDYIPCVFWGNNAKITARLNVGSHLNITGRIQSREFKKKISETIFEERTAYEVSVTWLEYKHDLF